MELFPEDSPIGTCKRQGSRCRPVSKKGYTRVLPLRTAFLLRRVVYKWALTRYIHDLEREDPQYLLKLIRRAVQISVVTVKTQEAVREAVAEVLPR